VQQNNIQISPDAPTLQLVPIGAPVARLRGVSKRFGDVEALADFNLQLHAGEALALFGTAGAGKSTAINILLGQRIPDQGEAQLFSSDPWFPQTRQAIGVVLQDTEFPTALRVCEVVDLIRAHYPKPRPTIDLLRQWGLQGQEQRQIRWLSTAQRRKLALALAFVGNPKVVFLDEPTRGLDLESREEAWQVIRFYHQQGGTVLFATRSLEEVEALATNVILLDRGQSVAEADAATIKAHVGLKRIHFKGQALPKTPGPVRVIQEHDGYSVYTSDADEYVRCLVRQGIAFEQLEISPIDLEEALLIVSGRTS
jgi:ABC-2 type transport system ATP-binding protein